MRYQPYYCEENIWWLCAEPPPGASIAQVIFVGSASGACPIAEQRAGGADGLVWWDYHCIGLDHERRVWDLDSRLPLPVPASTWLERSFPRAAELSTQRQPGFRVVSCQAQTICKAFAVIGATCAGATVVGCIRRRLGPVLAWTAARR